MATADIGQPIASTSTAGLAANGADERQIAIRLSTKDPKFQIPPAKFLVPASWRRFHLSELINKVLENGESRNSLVTTRICFRVWLARPRRCESTDCTPRWKGKGSHGA